MNSKDWILLIVPILCNGLVVFFLQRIFEKKQIVNDIKREYGFQLRTKIDLSLGLHAKALRLYNSGDYSNVNDSLIDFFNSVLDVYYYYAANMVVFKKFECDMERLSSKALALSKTSNESNGNVQGCLAIVDELRDELMKIKEQCIKLHF